jgi:hypothetical protein
MAVISSKIFDSTNVPTIPNSFHITNIVIFNNYATTLRMLQVLLKVVLKNYSGLMTAQESKIENRKARRILLKLPSRLHLGLSHSYLCHLT